MRIRKYSLIQFAGDDVDHSIRALDGSGTFHVMYIIAISTPFSGNSVLKECYKISRGKDITFEVSVNSKGTVIQNYVHPVNLHFHQFGGESEKLKRKA